MPASNLCSVLGMFVLLPLAFANQVNINQQSMSSQISTSNAPTSTDYFRSFLEAVDINFLHEALHALQSNHADGASPDTSAARATDRDFPGPATAELQLARRQDTQNAPLNSTQVRASEFTTSITVSPTATAVVTVTQTSSVKPSSLSSNQASSIATPSTFARSSTTVQRSTQTSKTITVAPTSPALSSTFVEFTSRSLATPGSAYQSATFLSSSTSLFITTITPTNGDAPMTITSLAVVGVSGNPEGAKPASSTAKPSGTLRNAGANLRAPHFSSSFAAAALILLGQVLIFMI